MGGGGGQPGWIAQRTQDTGCRTHGTHETHEIRSYGNVPARISKKKDLGMQDCQDREKTKDKRGGDCTQKGKTQLGGDSHKVDVHTTQAESVFCDELTNQFLVFKGDFSVVLA